jgi:predicted metal-dependent hydrolase
VTALKIRKLPWSFGPDTPFQWNPANPTFGLSMNTLSFFAPAFERYIVLAVREALRVIEDPEVRSEADAFLRQEGLHASAHRAHVAALVAQHPGLAEVSEELDRSYDALLRTQSLHYHLAYIADVEATFTPLFDMWLRHRDTLFDNGDHRVAPLFMWHLVEEIEHRSSALVIYDEVVKHPWYRLRQAPSVFSHVLAGANTCARGFNRHVPRSVRGADAYEQASTSPARIFTGMLSRKREDAEAPSPFATVPRREKWLLFYRLLRSQRPGHSPAHERTPPFADEWLAAYDAGRDVVDWYAQ